MYGKIYFNVLISNSCFEIKFGIWYEFVFDILDVFVRFKSMICAHSSQDSQPSDIDSLFMKKSLREKDGKYVTIQMPSVESFSDEFLLASVQR